jgi:hypothetical protein
VKNPQELQMGSTQYGQLILDGKPLPTEASIEFESLTWSGDRRLLAGQELVSWLDEPETRVIVIDADRRTQIAASRAHKGLCDPIRFEQDALVYRHWHHRGGERELRLPLSVTGETASRRSFTSSLY